MRHSRTKNGRTLTAFIFVPNLVPMLLGRNRTYRESVRCDSEYYNSSAVFVLVGNEVLIWPIGMAGVVRSVVQPTRSDFAGSTPASCILKKEKKQICQCCTLLANIGSPFEYVSIVRLQERTATGSKQQRGRLMCSKCFIKASARCLFQSVARQHSWRLEIYSESAARNRDPSRVIAQQ